MDGFCLFVEFPLEGLRLQPVQQACSKTIHARKFESRQNFHYHHNSLMYFKWLELFKAQSLPW